MTRSETERALKLLRKLLADLGDVSISRKSLDILISRFEEQLRNVAPGKESKLLDYWEREMPGFRQRLVTNATRTRTFDNRQLVLVTEDAAAVATRMCPTAPDLP